MSGPLSTWEVGFALCVVSALRVVAAWLLPQCAKHINMRSVTCAMFIVCHTTPPFHASQIWLDQADGQVLVEGEEITFMDWGNAFIRVSKSSNE